MGRTGKGYCWCPRNKSYVSQLSLHGKKYFVGHFKEEAEAKETYAHIRRVLDEAELRQKKDLAIMATKLIDKYKDSRK
jgi:hypothetical protein